MRNLTDEKESEGKRDAWSKELFVNDALKEVVEGQAHQVICISAKEPVRFLPSNRGLDFSFRVLVQKYVERDAGFH